MRVRVRVRVRVRGRVRVRVRVGVRARVRVRVSVSVRARTDRGLARESPRAARRVALARVWVGSLDEVKASDGQLVRLARDAEAAVVIVDGHALASVPQPGDAVGTYARVGLLSQGVDGAAVVVHSTDV